MPPDRFAGPETPYPIMKKAGQFAASSGFTLLEVIATLVILAVLSFSVVAGLRSSPPVRVEAEVLKSNLRYVEALALANNTAVWSVRFDAGSYTLQRDPVIPGSPARWPGENSATHELADGVRFTDGAPGELVFNAWGAPAAEFNLTLTSADRAIPISVSAITGFIP